MSEKHESATMPELMALARAAVRIRERGDATKPPVIADVAKALMPDYPYAEMWWSALAAAYGIATETTCVDVAGPSHSTYSGTVAYFLGRGAVQAWRARHSEPAHQETLRQIAEVTAERDALDASTTATRTHLQRAHRILIGDEDAEQDDNERLARDVLRGVESLEESLRATERALDAATAELDALKRRVEELQAAEGQRDALVNALELWVETTPTEALRQLHPGPRQMLATLRAAKKLDNHEPGAQAAGGGETR